MTDFTPPPGFEPFAITESFAGLTGPYFRADGPPRVGLFTEPRHANIAGAVHGGALATLADMALFAIGGGDGQMVRGVTLSLNTTFVTPGRVGRFLVAGGRIVKAGRSIIFVDGDIVDEDDIVMTFSGTLKRLPPR